MFGELFKFINGMIDRIWPKKRRKVKVLDARGDVFEPTNGKKNSKPQSPSNTDR